MELAGFTREVTVVQPHEVVDFFRPLIHTYFPPSAIHDAECMLAVETAATAATCPNPVTCVLDVTDPLCDSAESPGEGKSYGLYGLIDACWNPQLGGPNTPFTVSEWAHVLDPNINIWMASVIWSIGGWRSWTTCSACGVCDVPGGPIPHPRHALNNWAERRADLLLALGGVALAGAIVYFALTDHP